MNFTIRCIGPEDYQALIDLFKEFSVFENQPQQMINSAEKMKTEHDLINGYVAINSDEKIVGYATCFLAYYTWKGKSLYMDDLYVKPEYRGLGIGKSLIDKIIEFAKTENCYKIRWQVSHWNTKAQEFYIQLGAEISQSEWNCDLLISK